MIKYYNELDKVPDIHEIDTPDEEDDAPMIGDQSSRRGGMSQVVTGEQECKDEVEWCDHLSPDCTKERFKKICKHFCGFCPSKFNAHYNQTVCCYM